MTALAGDATKYAAALGTEGQLPRERHRSRIPQRLHPYLMIAPVVILFLGLIGAPIVILIRYSLLDNVIFVQQSHFVGLSNYSSILGSATFWSAAEHTLIFTAVCVVGQLGVGFAFATLLNTKNIGSVIKAVFRVIYILPWMFTAVIVALLWRLLLDPNGVINYLLGLIGVVRTEFPWLATPGWAMACIIVINIWAGYPFFMITLLAGLQSISPELYEAARVDGASYGQQLRSVTLPQLRPIIVGIGLLDVLWTTQQFTLVWVMTGGGPLGSTQVLGTYIYTLAFQSYLVSPAAASAILLLLGSLVVAVFYVRHQRRLELT
ncbi:MAG: carbohydrate ABC transporter permease [Acidimicrobiales bacterium]|jgi:multiple sugar transport system permease protein